MKHRAHAPLMAMLLCALAPAALTRCGGSADDPNGNQLLGTETGNPPVIKKAELHLEVAPGGMRLLGNPGAITARAEVRVTNQRTGESATTTAAADGSVEVTFAGDSSDVYEVTVTTASGTTSVTLTAADLPSDLSTLSCEALGNSLAPVIAATYAEADHSCAVDADCAERYWGEGCYNRCGSEILTASAVDATSALAEQRIAGLCGEIEARGCRNDAPPCAPSPERLLRCEQGQCVGRQLGELTCTELSNEASTRRQAAAEGASRSCDVDADCALLQHDLSCLDDCGGFFAPIASSAHDAAKIDIERADEALCGEFERDACQVLALPCDPGSPGTRTPICVQGQCEVRFEPLE